MPLPTVRAGVGNPPSPPRAEGSPRGGASIPDVRLYILGKVRTLLELADEQWANVGWTGYEYDTVMINSATAESTKTVSEVESFLGDL